MAKSKYAPALFEVISTKDEKSSGKLSLPKWWRGKAAPASPAQPSEPAAPSPASNPQTSAQPADTATGQAASDASSSQALHEMPQAATQVSVAEAFPAAEVRSAPRPPQGAAAPRSSPAIDDGRHPVARVREGRVEMSLNSTNMAITVGVLLIGLFLSYQIGRGLSSSSAPGPVAQKTDEIDSVAQGPTNQAALQVPTQGERSPGRSPAAPNPTPSGGTPNKPRVTPATPPAATPPKPQTPPAPTGVAQRTPGLNYVVLESFKHEHKAEAERIRDWLKANAKVDTTVESNGDKWQLVSSQGYDYNKDSDKRDCQEFRKMVVEWGQKYKDEFGSRAQYRLHAPELKKFTKQQ